MAEYRLTASKAKLYALAKRDFPDIGPMRRTEFIRYRRARDYGLFFSVGTRSYRMRLSACCGRVMLEYIWFNLDEPGDGTARWESRTLHLDELKEFGLLEEISNGAGTQEGGKSCTSIRESE